MPLKCRFVCTHLAELSPVRHSAFLSSLAFVVGVDFFDVVERILISYSGRRFNYVLIVNSHAQKRETEKEKKKPESELDWMNEEKSLRKYRRILECFMNPLRRNKQK